jgi:outer membrane protein OmpA-like peptidoglycan-associated protein
MVRRFWIGLALGLAIPGLMFAASCANKQVECGPAWLPDVKVAKVVKDVAKVVKDSDGDGVPDDLDKCPNTPKGATVNSVGCWALKGVVLFDFDKADIKPEAHQLLDEVVTILKKNREMKGVIEGHTDSMGSEEYNQGLSERRAQAVEKYIEEHGIDADRYTIKGYGESNPIASNDTEEGRQENRRVELRRVR